MLIKNFDVRYSELGPDGSLPVWALQNYAQQAAALDASSLSAGLEDLARQDAAWVLIKLEFKIKSKISNAGTISVKTWHAFSDKIKSRREFVFLDEKGEEIAAALSWWLILNFKTRKIVKTPQYMFKKDAEPVLIMEEYEIKRPKFDGDLQGEAFGALPMSEIEIVSRLEDIDLNGHVNNTHFTAWALEGVPQEIRFGKSLKNIAIDFKTEVAKGDKIIVKTYRNEDLSFWHILNRKSDSKEIAAAYSKWE
jgi:acyl-ACP thioesterase